MRSVLMDAEPLIIRCDAGAIVFLCIIISNIHIAVTYSILLENNIVDELIKLHSNMLSLGGIAFRHYCHPRRDILAADNLVDLIMFAFMMGILAL